MGFTYKIYLKYAILESQLYNGVPFDGLETYWRCRGHGTGRCVAQSSALGVTEAV